MQQNAMNHKINIKNSTGHSGVSFDKKRNKYYARIRKNYKNKFLGYYDNIEDAITAREKAEIELFGEYRCKEQ